ncbi:MAG: hypothetical protein HYW47_02520 [Deltaproteobacteria bacterium]|nr:hypothetical protein [Deltaproteobacteria bacterium]
MKYVLNRKAAFLFAFAVIVSALAMITCAPSPGGRAFSSVAVPPDANAFLSAAIDPNAVAAQTGVTGGVIDKQPEFRKFLEEIRLKFSNFTLVFKIENKQTHSEEKSVMKGDLGGLEFDLLKLQTLFHFKREEILKAVGKDPLDPNLEVTLKKVFLGFSVEENRGVGTVKLTNGNEIPIVLKEKPDDDDQKKHEKYFKVDIDEKVLVVEGMLLRMVFHIDLHNLLRFPEKPGTILKKNVTADMIENMGKLILHDLEIKALLQPGQVNVAASTSMFSKTFPVSDVLIQAVDPKNVLAYETSTDKDGKGILFLEEIKEGNTRNFQLTLSKPLYQDFTFVVPDANQPKLSVTPGNVFDRVVNLIYQGAALKVSVLVDKNLDGNFVPEPGVKVSLSEMVTQEPLMVTTTDSIGDAYFLGFEKNQDVTIKAEMPNFLTQEVVIPSIPAGENLQLIRLVINQGKFAARNVAVFDNKTGDPVKSPIQVDLNIYEITDVNFVNSLFHAGANQNGEFNFETLLLPPGEFVLIISATDNQGQLVYQETILHRVLTGGEIKNLQDIPLVK